MSRHFTMVLFQLSAAIYQTSKYVYTKHLVEYLHNIESILHVVGKGAFFYVFLYLNKSVLNRDMYQHNLYPNYQKSADCTDEIWVM